MQVRKIALCVESWASVENHFLWNFTRKRLLKDKDHCLQPTDRIYVVHVNTNKAKDGDTWEKGTAVLSDVQTELADYDHSLVELEGDPVNAIVEFLIEEQIEIAVVSSKDQNRVKRRMASNSAAQISSKSSCACVIVGPRFSAGDHFRMQAKRQPDALVANSVLQFRRRVLILLNNGLWDSALVQYAAKNLICPGDLVLLVRCVNENVHRKNTQQFQTERDNMRELGWHKFRQKNISLAVDVVKNSKRDLCAFIESKGIDLLVMPRCENHKMKIPMKKETTFHEKCPCPLMTVPIDLLKHFPSCNSCRNFAQKRNHNSPLTPLISSLSRLRKKGRGGGGNFSRLSVFHHGSPFKGVGRGRRCQSFDSVDNQQESYYLDYLRSDSVDLTTTRPSTMELTAFQCLGKDLGDRDPYQEKVRVLQQELSEKEKEVLVLKQCINHLQKHDGN